ncbi:MAG TPA: tetratricopeptide repeat protein [Verrucomicrobiae bacterium]|nr:tetratricopeptide repeat protein [Verrucomicrobiae bacterium]
MPAEPATGRSPGTKTPFGTSDWLLALLLVAATFLAYFPVWHGLPIWDDGSYITRARFGSLDGLRRMWFEPGTTEHYYPLLDTVFWVQSKLWGGSTLGYHLVTIACHAAGALLVLKILRRLQVKGAWLAAAIFALHPVHVESVAWISELKNTMSGVFYLGAALAYLEFDETESLSWFAFTAVLFLSALLCKTTVVVWPFAMLVIVWWKHGRLSWKRNVLPLLPLLAFAAVDGYASVWVDRRVISGAVTQLQFPLMQRLVIAGHACWFYIGKLLWPVDLCPIYPRWQLGHATAADYLYPVGMLALLIGLWLLRNRTRAPLAAALFFVVTLLPVLGLISFSYFQFSFVADHFQYLASLGIITLIAAGGAHLQETCRSFSRPVWMGLWVAVLVALAGLTWSHSWVYTDVERFARATLARDPDSWAGHDFLGMVLTSQGKTAEAIDHFNKALQGNPRYALGHYNLGCALALQGKLTEAMQQYEQALQLQPDFVRAHYNLGCVLALQGNFDGAIEQYEDALRLKPDSIDAPEFHNNLGIALASSGKLDEAIEHFRQAVRLRPAFADAHANLGHAFSDQKKFDEAIEHYEQAVQLTPDSATSCEQLARLLVLRGGGNPADSTRAVQLAERACQLTENRQPVCLDTLAGAYAATRRFADATAMEERALELARAAGQTNLTREIQSHLKLYQDGLSREASGPANAPDH